MITKFLTSLVIALLVILTISNINFSNSGLAVVTPLAILDGNGFLLTENGETTIKVGINPQYSQYYKTFFAGNVTGKTLYQINLKGNTAANCKFGPAFAIADTASSLATAAKNLTITINTTCKISGTFVITKSIRTNTSINFTFKNSVMNT